MLEEFKKFAIKGNVVDMGVGIIIGSAFGAIVTSLVNDILMPPIGFIMGNVDFSDKVLKIGDVAIKYGVFTNTIINFIIVALAMFLIIKQVNRLKTKEVAPETPTEPPADIKLLTEIRDELKRQQ